MFLYVTNSGGDCVFGQKKRDAFLAYYYAGEGRNLIALAELFLEQISEKIENGEIVDFSRDYRFTTGDFTFKLIYSEQEKHVVKFFARDTRKQWNLLELRYSSGGDEIKRHVCEAFYVHKKQWHSVYMSDYALFRPLLDKMKKVVRTRYIDIDIAPHLIERVDNLRLLTAPEVIATTRELVQAHRNLFDKHFFSIITHTIKTLEETVPLLEESNPFSEELTRMIRCNLLEIIQKYVALSEEGRTKHAEKLTEYLNGFYLKALDVQSWHA